MNAVRLPVRPATRWMRVVSMASARVMAGRIGAKRRASIDVPRSRGTQEEQMMIKTPAARSPSHPQLAVISTPQDDVAALSHGATTGAAMLLDYLPARSPAQDSSSSKPLASWRSAVSKPSVNQP
jgi:hypothetical protein